MQVRTDGDLIINGLRQLVELWRDPWGIPHIKAQNEWDVFVALGYAHAQDRLWQMDMQRRKAVGRWAEWRGAEALESDRLARRLGGRAVAQRDYAALGRDAQEMLQAYAVGVNAFIGQGVFPREYALLEEVPEEWESWHSIAVMRQIGFLMGSFWLKLFRASVLPAVGAEAIGKLRYDDGAIDLVCIPQGAQRTRWAAVLAELRPSIDALLRAQAPDQMAGGSNNWAISGKHSATGRPILMGDPHRELEVPTMYAQAHIACDSFDGIGLTVPGVPGFPHVAHNNRLAWCVTHAFMDIHDLYIEQFRNGGSEVLFKDDWYPTARRTEIVCVRNAPDAKVEVIETRHGPVIAGDARSGAALTLRSAQFAEADTSFDCLPKMLKSTSVSELFQVVKPWGLIDHNLVAADVDGRIGHRVRAKVPRRPRANGWLPMPGWTGEYDWNGMIPAAEMPQSIDPPSGRIVTANNRVVEDDEMQYLCTDCHPPYRAIRITELLDGLHRPSIESMTPIYTDLLSAPGLLFRDRLRHHTAKSAQPADLLARIIVWDGRMAPESAGALAYSLFRRALTEVIAERSGVSSGERGLGSELVDSTSAVSHLWWVIPTLLRTEDVDLLGGLSWSEVIDTALDRAAACSPDGTWSDLHAPVLKHPLSPVFPEAAHELDVPSAPFGGDNDTVFATGYSAGHGFQTKYSALARTSFDVGNWGNCSWIVFQGASGHPDSPHRQDQHQHWANGVTVPMLYDWNEIASRSKSSRLGP